MLCGSALTLVHLFPCASSEGYRMLNVLLASGCEMDGVMDAEAGHMADAFPPFFFCILNFSARQKSTVHICAPLCHRCGISQGLLAVAALLLGNGV